jgi:hypothetical protein
VPHGEGVADRQLQSPPLLGQSKCFIQKTNGCSEHGIILSELLHDANRKNEVLIVAVIDFTNAFGSVPHELIMTMM